MIVGQEKPSLDSLAHYGTKGMKWGVRREQKRQVKQNVNAFNTTFHSKTAYGTREISEYEYSKLPNKPIKLGKDFKRVANSSGEFRDFVYVSKTADDHTRYTAILRPTTAKGKVLAPYDATIKTTKEAISPGMKERVDTYVKVLDKDVVGPDGKTIVKAKQYVAGTNAAANALSSRELGFATYQMFAQSQQMLLPIHTAYFNELSKKGYTAVIDDADKNIMSDLPIILFPKDVNARVTELKPITKDDIFDAKLKLKPVGYGGEN